MKLIDYSDKIILTKNLNQYDLNKIIKQLKDYHDKSKLTVVLHHHPERKKK